MERKKVLASITKICGGRSEKFVGVEKKPCEHFDPVALQCALLQVSKIPNIWKAIRCQSIVMFYAEVLSKELWDQDGRVTDHEDLPFETLFNGLQEKSIRGFDKDKGQRYDIGYWHGYIRKAVTNALLKQAQKDRAIVREASDNSEGKSDTENQKSQRKGSAQSSFAEKAEMAEDALNAKVDLSMLVEALSDKIDNPDTSEKERSLCRRRRTLIINILQRVRRDKFANDACRTFREERVRTQRERERLKAEMKFDRDALMNFFLKKKTVNLES